jgi:hypothetical protein
MVTKKIGISGIIILIASLMLMAYLIRLDGIARNSDKFLFLKAMNGGKCFHPIIDAEIARRVISINESEAITVKLTNSDTQPCTVKVKISAPNFKLDQDNENTVELPPKETVTLPFIITPTSLGSQKIAICAGLDTKIIGIKVTDVLGLNAKTSKIMSYVGTFLGSGFTLTWLVETALKIKKKKKKRKK